MQTPLSAFQYIKGAPRTYKQENGVVREFCEKCGAFICEYGLMTDSVNLQEQAADKFRYVMWGTFDEPEKVPPKGEFFCQQRVQWMPEIRGMASRRLIETCEG
ncbi:hypothetical protein HIM_03787 [Hirsutella minnesotensis 3608]|uniref:CENP-V/GFA domain-containing protein n=1 Tax=Hirsutella minnesotensis 3608 TaxID=1043627 RepID=A0A0F7ZQA5_9HYPO|nr:hypothetical protein HIM_03787 [Hirsutella minnesotensis 3608]